MTRPMPGWVDTDSSMQVECWAEFVAAIESTEGQEREGMEALYARVEAEPAAWPHVVRTWFYDRVMRTTEAALAVQFGVDIPVPAGRTAGTIRFDCPVCGWHAATNACGNTFLKSVQHHVETEHPGDPRAYQQA